ncbi:MAG: YIP1 family protein [Tannerella sp.]|jgi:hypothetical protein|nr:YIP1 family protein [Tannerella sp.]
MFKDLFKLATALILKPSETWIALKGRDEGTRNDLFLRRYIYPLLGVVVLASFAGIFLSRSDFDFQIALKSLILSLAAYLGGFFLASYALNYVWIRYFRRESDYFLCQRFAGYSSTLIYALSIVLSLLPEFFFLRIIVLYTVYMVWEGSIRYMQIRVEEQMKFVLSASALVILSPWVIEFLLRMLMPGLRI